MNLPRRYENTASPLRRSPFRREISLRAWFNAFAVTSCVAIIAVFIADAMHEREVATDVARRAAENLSESLAQQASDALDGASGALAATASRVEHGGTAPSSRAQLEQTMRALVAAVPRMSFLGVFDERGRYVVTTIDGAQRRAVGIADRAYFLYHRSHRGKQVYVSGPARGKIRGRWQLFASRRLEHADGTFAGVVVAPIALDIFARSYANVDVGRFGNITLFNTDGTIVVRKPPIFIGVRFPEAGFRAHLAASSQSDWYLTSARADGHARLFAFRRVRRYPLVVRVGVAESDYLAAWLTDTRRKSVEVGFIVIMIGLLASALTTQIEERKVAQDRLEQLALLDGLTGIANRRQFDEVLEREWRDAERRRAPLALLMIDVDHFKLYNDRYGHQQGDDVLVRITRAIAADVKRPGDLAARYGGEEFVVVLRATDEPSALVVAERIRGAIAALGIPHAATQKGIVSVSIGVAVLVPLRNETQAKLLATADKALYDAKRLGRNRISTSADATGQEIQE